jgi:pyrimidine-specific ribonucleoside hydrolase
MTDCQMMHRDIHPPAWAVAPVEAKMAGSGTDRSRDAYDEHQQRETFTDRDPVAVWRYLVWEAESMGHHDEAKKLREAGPPPGPGMSDLRLSPQILTLEVGGDPGGALALTAAALNREQLRLVIAIGDAEAARFARHLLDLLGRTDVTVVASSAPAPAASAIAGLIPAHVPPQPTNVLAAVQAVTTTYPYVIRWGNHGPLTDLASVFAVEPALADRLLCFVALGPDGTVSMADPASASAVLNTIHRPPPVSQDPRVDGGRPSWPHLLVAPYTDYTLQRGSSTEQMLADQGAVVWAQLLAAHLAQWFAQGHPTASIYPVLLVAELADIPYIEPLLTKVTADDAGYLHIGQSGSEMYISDEPAVDVPLTYWLHRVLGLERDAQ